MRHPNRLPAEPRTPVVVEQKKIQNPNDSFTVPRKTRQSTAPLVLEDGVELALLPFSKLNIEDSL